MKRVNLVKIISLIAICALLIGAAVFAASATMEQQTLEISKKNILFSDRMHLMFALKATENVQVNATCGDVDVAIEYMGIETIEGEDYRVYQTVDGWAPQNINAVVTQIRCMGVGFCGYRIYKCLIVFSRQATKRLVILVHKVGNSAICVTPEHDNR
jgi:hypothetical protein